MFVVANHASMERKFNVINHISGWIVFIAALIVYTLTLEPTVSLWDCGEFISCAYKLQIPHPPGAPFFVLIGRIFSMFAPSPEYVAFAVNMLSAVASAGAVMFLFWVTVFFARRLLIKDEKDWNWSKIIVILGAGAVGAFAGAFADSFWFSAVEGEVYALSAFFTMLILWAMIRWVRAGDSPHADRWLLFISLVVGMVIGVHLLGLLVIPAITLLYFQKKGKLNTFKDFVKAFVIGSALLGFVQYIFIPGIPRLTAYFELFFVNTLGFPFYTGLFVALSFIALVITGLIYWTHKAGKRLLNMGALALAMLMLGYGVYALVMIRSYANPPIDMNDPEDPFSLLSYLNREQYGDRPLLKGPYFTSQIVDYKQGEPRYRKNEETGRYEIIGHKIIPVYDKEYFFPRIWSQQDQHIQFYRSFLGLTPNEEPTFLDNMKFFFQWQIGWMYIRYFLWNFAGRQNDIQGFGGIKYGNWQSGITPFDEMHLDSPQKIDELPVFQQTNKGRNYFYMLPLLLGILGLLFQFNRRSWDGWIVFVLFFMTGLAIVIWLNQTPLQPRERDYSYAGSFLAFAIWVGLGVVALYELTKRFIKKDGIHIALPIATLAFFAGPFLMGYEGWDDHSRAHRFTARDFAINYLESCDSNAILFTEGDNDTYPLWYAQEVEGIRTDVRIVNLSLLGVDWYIDFLRRKVNDADPVPINVPRNKYLGSTRDYVRYTPDSRYDQNRAYDLNKVLEFIYSDHPATRFSTQTGFTIDYLPVKKVFLNIPKEKIIANKVVEPEDTGLIVDRMEWTLPNALIKNHLMTLTIIANNDWERPIHFAVTIRPSSYVGLKNYLQLEGLTYQLVPIKAPSNIPGFMGRVQTNVMYSNVINKFRWGNMDKYNIYLDESHRRMASNHRIQLWRLVEALIAENKKDSALKIIDLVIEKIPDSVLLWESIVAQLAANYYKLDKPEKARSIYAKMLDRNKHDFNYYISLNPNAFGEYFPEEFQRTLYTTQFIGQMALMHGDSSIANKATQILLSVDSALRSRPDLSMFFQR